MSASTMELTPLGPVEKYCLRTEELLKLERDAELEQARHLHENISPKLLEKRGVCLTKLVIDERKTSLYGRQILTLKPSNVNRPELPASDITTGDIVGLHQIGGNADVTISSGIVVRVASTYISIAFDQSDELSNIGDDCQYYVIKLANDVTYRRLKRALSKLKTGRRLPSDRLISLLFNQSKDETAYDSIYGSLAGKGEFKYYNSSLDESQRQAVQLALSQQQLAIIHGPPGTGKTTTVVEVIRQLVAQGLKVLACAPSNVAVDNLVLRLAKAKVGVTRLGHPARVMHEIQSYSLDAKVSASDEGCLVEDIRKEIDTSLRNMKQSAGRPSYHSLRNELKTLRKELKERSNTAVRQVLKNSQVILSTLTSATDEGPLKILEDMHFDVVVIDECSQALEVACWIALLQAPKCILAGDHLQLPPTILSRKAAVEGLAITLMERLIVTQASHVHMLTVQYRMNSQIMQWASDELYRGKLTAHKSVADHLLTDMEGVEDNEITCEPLILIDTAGCQLYELDLPDEQSHGNEGEADLVTSHVRSLVDAGVKPSDIAVISPYNLQVELIRNRLSEKYRDLEIKSVDGYQGREKEVVIISLVRSNNKGVVGFLSEDRRLNVAVTRARRQVTVVCDGHTVSCHVFLSRLVTYMTEHGVVLSAAEFDLDSIGRTSDVVAGIITSNMSVKKSKPKVNRGQSKRSTNASKVTEGSNASPANKPASIEATVSIRESKEEREARIRQEMEKVLSDFLACDDTVHSFPSTLNSYERLVVHQIAEMYSVEHTSVGDGSDRHIVVRKPLKTKSEVKQEKHPIVKESLNAEASVDLAIAGSGSSAACELCGKEIPPVNLHLHRLRCTAADNKKQARVLDDQLSKLQPANQMSSDKPSSELSTKVKSAAKKEWKVKDKKTRDGNAMLNKVDADDFDALLDAAARLNSACSYKKCKTLVKTLGTNCTHCSLRFCLSHGMPEVHGCGAAAKALARSNINHSGADKKLSASARANLEKKLHKKVSKLTDKRKPKAK